MTWFSDLIEDLKRDEGFRARPYKCTADKLTIGYGRNLEDVGITRDEAEQLLANDIQTAIDMAQVFNWFGSLTPNRKRAIVNMIFNLGLTRFMKFKKMIAALDQGDYKEAARQARDSAWFKQVGDRANRVVELIERG